MPRTVTHRRRPGRWAQERASSKIRCANDPVFAAKYADKLRRKYRRRHERKKIRRQNDPVYAAKYAEENRIRMRSKYLRQNAIKIVEHERKRLERLEEKEQRRLAWLAMLAQWEQLRKLRDEANEARRVAPLVDDAARAELSKARKNQRRRTEKYIIKSRARGLRRRANRRTIIQSLRELGWLPQLNAGNVTNTWRPTDVQGAFRKAFGVPYIVIPRPRLDRRYCNYKCRKYATYGTPAIFNFAEIALYCTARDRRFHQKHGHRLRKKYADRPRIREKQISAAINALREMGWLTGYEVVDLTTPT